MYLFKHSILISFFLLGLLPNTKAQDIIFTEINYHSDSSRDSGDWVELYNNSNESIDLYGWQLKDANAINVYTLPWGTTLAPGAYLVVGNNENAFEQQYPAVNNFVGDFSFGFNNKTDSIRLFNSGGSLETLVHYFDSIPWPKAADGIGRTLEIIDPNSDPNTPDNWFVGCMGGSPGYAYSTCEPDIVFSEINFNPDSLNNNGDWVELWNVSEASIDLSVYLFRDGNDSNQYIFPPSTILAANERLVLTNNALAFSNFYPGVNYLGPFDFSLKNSGEFIRLYDNLGRIKYAMRYDDISPWPLEADGDGYTLELSDHNGNVNDGSNWFAGCLYGSPATPYDASDCTIDFVATPLAKSLAIQCRQSLQNKTITVQLEAHEAIAPSTANITIYNSLGNRIYHRKQLSHAPLILSTEHWQKGLYIILVNHEQVQASYKVMVTY